MNRCQKIFGFVLPLYFGIVPFGMAAEQNCPDRKLVKTGVVDGASEGGALVIGMVQGGGTLTVDSGGKHPFTLSGVTILDIGASKSVWTGTVYNLDNLKDFEGFYVGLTGGIIAGTSGLDGHTIGNGKCVVINLKATSGEGLRFALGGGGVTVKFK